MPGRMALLVTLFLMLVNISTSATSLSPKSDKINALQIWLLNCIVFVFLALMEYAIILYFKNMKGVPKNIFHSGILIVTPSSEPDKDCWINQQVRTNKTNFKHTNDRHDWVIIFRLKAWRPKSKCLTLFVLSSSP